MRDELQDSGSGALFRASISAHFAQVHLLSAGSLPPMFETGGEAVVFGPAGVSVATSDWDSVLVEVVVGPPTGDRWPAQRIHVAADGLQVGNDLAGDAHRLDWPAGFATVAVEVCASDARIERVRFHLVPA